MRATDKWAIGLAAGLLFAALVPNTLAATEGFEGFIPNTVAGVPFTVGTAPEEATFSGNAFAGVLGIGQLYNTGVRSWMVLENSVGRIDFDVNAASVDFFARTHSTADDVTEIMAFDSSSTQIGSTVTLQPGVGFTNIAFSGSIDYILIDNRATNIMNALDDLTYTAVPEPTTIMICGLGTLAMFGTRRCRRTA